MDQIGSAQKFSTIDRRSGYPQKRIAEKLSLFWVELLFRAPRRRITCVAVREEPLGCLLIIA